MINMPEDINNENSSSLLPSNFIENDYANNELESKTEYANVDWIEVESFDLGNF